MFKYSFFDNPFGCRVRDYRALMLLSCLLLALCIFEGAHAAAFNCAIRTSCDANETLLIRLNSSEPGAGYNNSHAQLANYSGTAYPFSVCCSTDTGRVMNNSCAGNGVTVIKLFNTTDSHVAIDVGYNYLACLNVSPGNITCEYPINSCTAGYSPIFSFASSDPADNNATNSHVADFSMYTRKVCCQIGGQNPPVVAYVNISPYPNATTRNDLECQNGSVTDADGDAVTLHYNWFRNSTSTTVLNLPMDYDYTAAKTHDISGNGRDATPKYIVDFINPDGSTFSPTGGYVGGTFNLNGDHYVEVPNSLDSSSMSVSAWINFYGTSNMQPIFSNRRDSSGCGVSTDRYGVIFYVNSYSTSDRSLHVEYGNSSNGCMGINSATNAIPLGTWTHVAFTLNSTNAVLYVNGDQVGSGAAYGRELSQNPVSWVGLLNSSSIGYRVFGDKIDEVMVYNRTLTPQEIKTIYGSNNRWLNNSELLRGDRWNCSITPVDSTGLNGSTRRSNQTNISGSTPSNVTLSYPINNNQTVFERYINFNWTAANERDGDGVNYTIYANVSAGACAVQLTYTNTTLTNHTHGELCVDQLYNWSVRACDIDGCSSWAAINNFTIASVLSIRLLNNNTNFGSLNLNQSIDTELGGVAPFRLENDGNVHVNVSLNGTNTPFTTATLNTTAFQYKARVNETGAFNTGASQMLYTPVNSTFTSVIKQLNYTDSNDAAYIDINITVPIDESAGYKEANITFLAQRWD